MSDYKQRLIELADGLRLDIPSDLVDLDLKYEDVWEYRHNQMVDELIFLINKLESSND